MKNLRATRTIQRPIKLITYNASPRLAEQTTLSLIQVHGIVFWNCDFRAGLLLPLKNKLFSAQCHSITVSSTGHDFFSHFCGGVWKFLLCFQWFLDLLISVSLNNICTYPLQYRLQSWFAAAISSFELERDALASSTILVISVRDRTWYKNGL